MRCQLLIIGSMLISFGLFGAGCGSSGDGLPACPSAGTDLTYDNFGKNFFESNCTSCHAVGSGQGEAEEYPFETLDQIQGDANSIYEQAGGSNTSMPPGSGGPNNADRQKLAEWLSCGAP